MLSVNLYLYKTTLL